MTDQPDLEALYTEAQQALKRKDYDRAAALLKQVLLADDDYKDASRLLAQAVRLKRRRWYNHPLFLGGLAGAALLALGIWLAPKAAPVFERLVATETRIPAPTRTPVPTETPAPRPTVVPLAWKRIYIGQEFPRDTITVIVFDPVDPDVLYVGTENAGVYKSIDGGGSWQPAHRGLGAAWVSSLVLDPQDVRTLYAAVALGGVYKTIDGGANWYAVNNGINTDGWGEAGALVFAPGSSTSLYYSQGRNFYATTNGGESWIQLSSDQDADCPHRVLGIAMDPANPANQFVFNDENPGEETVCKNGVYQSSDGGASWRLSLTIEPIFGLNPTTLAFDRSGRYLYVTDSQSFYRSTDLGETWQEMAISECNTLALDPRDGSRAYCDTHERIRVTQNGGQNWSDFLSHEEQFSARPVPVAVSPYSSQTVLVGWDGLWRTADSGRSWDSLNNGLGMLHLDLSLDLLDPSALLLEDATCAIHLSNDGGFQWNFAPDRTCRSQTTLNASGEWFFWVDKDTGKLRASSDKGITYQPLNWPIQTVQFEMGYENPPEIISSHPADANRLLAVYAFEYPYIFITDDNGAAWRSATLLDWPAWLKMGPSPRVFYDSSHGNRVYIIQMSFVFRSDDAGASWQLCPGPGDVYLGLSQRKAGLIVRPENADRLTLATRGEGILVSMDGCQTWSSSNTGLDNLFINTIAVDPADPDKLYAGTDGGAYVSFNGGETWYQINDGLLGATVVYSIVVDEDGTVYAATPYGIFRLEGK